MNYAWLYVCTSEPDGHRIKAWLGGVALAAESVWPLAGGNQ